MITDVKDSKDKAVKAAAELVLNRMWSAPKAKGADDVALFLVDGVELTRLADWMESFGKEQNRPGFVRDSANLRNASCLLLIAARRMTMGLNCAMCGSPDCASAQKADANCVFPVMDLGIAAGSGASLCQEFGLDNRMMFSAGLAAVRMGLFGEEPSRFRAALGIPLQVSSKNIFFDRK
jgi:uncharacterized ferredoxin-like protein